MLLSARPLALLALLFASAAIASAQVPTSPPISPRVEPDAQIPRVGQARKPALEIRQTKPEPKGPAPSRQQIGALAAQLDSDEFRSRESAQIELTKLATAHPEVALDAILEEYLDTGILEARYRLRGILYRSKQAEFLKIPRGFVGIVMGRSFVRAKNGELIHAIQVGQVVPDSAAEKFGLEVLDQIIGMDGKPLSAEDALNDFANYITGKSSGDEVELTIQRRAQEMKLKLTLGQRPEYLLGQDPRLQDRFEADFKNWLDESSDRLRGKN